MATPELSNSGVPQDELAILTGYFVDAQARLAEIVRHPFGKTEAAKEFRAARSAVQGSQIDQILTRLRGQTAGWIGSDDTFAQAVKDGRERADRQATDAGVRIEDSASGRFDLIDARTAAVFARDAAQDLTKATTLMGDRSKGLLRATAQNDLSEADINKILAGGAIEGKPRDTIRRLRDAFNAVVNDGSIEINGRNYDVARYSEMVVRTKTREAVEVSRHERLADLGIDTVAVIGRLSTNFCSAFLGPTPRSSSVRRPRRRSGLTRTCSFASNSTIGIATPPTRSTARPIPGSFAASVPRRGRTRRKRRRPPARTERWYQ